MHTRRSTIIRNIVKFLAMSATEVEDDIYTGYNDYPSVYNIKDLEQDELFQEVIKTSYGKRSIVSITISHYVSALVIICKDLYIQHFILHNAIFITKMQLLAIKYLFFFLQYIYFISYLIVYSKNTRHGNASWNVKSSKLFGVYI